MNTSVAGTSKRIVVISPDGSQTDVTEGVQVAYDLVLGSLDFASGFLTLEDILPLRQLAGASGFRETPLDDYEREWRKRSIGS